LQNGLAAPPQPEGLRLEDLFDVPPPEYEGTYPLVTVAVCTRDRTSDLALCLDALCQLDYPSLDILVVDNAPTSDATEKLVETYPNVRYVCEPRPGLDWARNRAIIEAKAEIVAYTDDDVVVDSEWVKALAKVFAENPEVMAVTGLVVPYELETEAQVLFEMYGGFGRGFERKWYYPNPQSTKQAVSRYACAGQFGTGANMAYRRCLFDQIGLFDPALDVGTVTNGGGDLEMFFRLLQEGYPLVYEPSAMVRHRHRRDRAKLKSQIANNGIGLYAYYVRSALAYPDGRFAFIQLGIWWLWWWLIQRLWNSLVYPIRFPRDFIMAEFWGSFIGLTRYQKARRNAAEIAKSFGGASEEIKAQNPVSKQPVAKCKEGRALRTVELSQPLEALTDIADYSTVRVFVKWKDWPVGSLDLPNPDESISKSRLIEGIVNTFGLLLLELDHPISKDVRWNQAMHALKVRYAPAEKEIVLPERLPPNVSVSVVVGTYDRPNDLRNCLRCLFAQESPRRVEIVIVDNHPASGLTPPVVAEFPEVVLVNEPRQGVAYARNAGVVASTGDICVTTDDDVTPPTDWLEKLVAPFARPDVMIVTGNVLPIELETDSQCLFEAYGGLSRGFWRWEVNGDWLESFPRKAVPTWELGATANAAFRASIFSHPDIGLMDEALGPGMPSGVGEDTYLFYKVLKAGYTLVYEPKAYVLHKHRREMSELRRQIYNYSKGHVAYHLTTWLRDRDWRGVVQILVGLPLFHVYRIKERLLHRSEYPISLVLLEIAGNLAGPWSLWQSHQRVRQEGRSRAYIPVPERSVSMLNPPLYETPQYATVSDLQ
jgi:GT2 family glycosyltransferase